MIYDMQNMNHETTAATARHTALPDTVALEGEELVIIDQTELPRRLKLLHLSERYEIFEAIKSLRVRGAPAIGVAAAIGLYIAAHRKLTQEPDITSSAMLGHIAEERDYLASSRPTAVNLFWALDRMYARAASLADESPREITEGMRAEAIRIRDEDIASCRRIAENGLSLLKPGNGILTHCNAGQLAAVRYGTALAPIHLGAERGYDFRVYTDETRPLLQGMRLSAFELSEAGINTTVICDNMVGSVMKQGLIDAVIVGADRIAANGDTANKIGTSVVAILAKYYGIPFYVAAPRSTFDPNAATGDDIPVELRDADEIGGLYFREDLMPEHAKAYNPAFDITDHSLITAFITDEGIQKR